MKSVKANDKETRGVLIVNVGYIQHNGVVVLLLLLNMLLHFRKEFSYFFFLTTRKKREIIQFLFLSFYWRGAFRKPVTYLRWALRKIPKFHLISWCENFVKRHNFDTSKLGETTAFYAVEALRVLNMPLYCIHERKTRMDSYL